MGGHFSYLEGLSAEEVEEMVAVSGFNSEQVKRLFERFIHLDRDGKGSINVEDFFNIPELAMNPLISRIIAVFDEDNRDSVNFRQFCETLSIFRPETEKVAKVMFAFRIYDVNNDGFIDLNELISAIKMMVGDNFTNEQINQIAEKTIKEADIIDNDGKISFAEFQKILGASDIISKLSINF